MHVIHISWKKNLFNRYAIKFYFYPSAMVTLRTTLGQIYPDNPSDFPTVYTKVCCLAACKASYQTWFTSCGFSEPPVEALSSVEEGTPSSSSD